MKNKWMRWMIVAMLSFGLLAINVPFLQVYMT